MNFMKGMYLIWPDYDYIDKAIDAGIDTLLVNLEINNNEEIEKIFKKYSSRVNCIPVRAWLGRDKIIPQEQRFFNGSVYYKHVQCPTNVEYIKSLLKQPLNLVNRYNCNTIGIDFEYYLADIKYYEEWENGHQCRCEQCKSLSEREQRVNNAELIRQELKGNKLYHLPVVNPYLWQIGEVWCNEFTYEDMYDYGKILKNTYKIKSEFNVTTDNVSGLWVEKFTAKDYLKALEKSIKSPANDGYWLYPQMRMSRNCYWRLEPESDWAKESLPDLPYQSLIDSIGSDSDPNFFIKLRELNDSIDELRNGLVYNIKSAIYKFFR